MIVAILALFFTVVLSGFLVKVFPPTNIKWLKMALAFSGAYLFTITIIHLLPDVLLNSHSSPYRVGYWVLAGFFLQLVLELFSHGVEHGHIHHHHGRTDAMPFLLLGSLFVHSFLEGSILVDQGHSHSHGGGHAHASDNFYAVLLGIALHHIPAAFALMSVLMSRLENFRKAFLWLLIFAVGSPLGIVVSNTVLSQEAPDGLLFTALTGLVAGNFLHISTTILFETSPDHHFNRNKLVATLLGLVLALLSDFI
ncbi:ZIP family metal transporter [Pontibacter litorisediminis]|uniref:ZIP family metal transporter n=1 Tax=Pontibacter litorisediminis TaxID=1846260 RepID=UPI0023EBCCE8|nr:ZIP family metal transporter [Pontibacter litorisediminis]